MANKTSTRKQLFTVINQATSNTAWNGSPVKLLPNESAQMTQTPNGSAVLAYQNMATENSPATLALTTGTGDPVFLTAPAPHTLPNILIKNWRGANLGITNVTPPHIQAPVNLQLIAPGLSWLTPAVLKANADVMPLGPGQAVQGPTQPRWMQVMLQADTSQPAVFVIIGGPPDATGNNAYVVALNAPQETGAGTTQTPPTGYFATSAGAVYTYQLNWGATTVFVANVSGAAATVGLRAL